MNKGVPSAQAAQQSVSEEVTAASICEELWQLLRAYKTHMWRIADSYGLTVVQFGALFAISEQEQGSATMGKVANALHCDASNATGIIDRLTALKLVIRQDNPNDRRVKSLLLTPTGNATLQKILDEMPKALGCDCLTQDELRALHHMVRKLSDSVL